MLNRLRIADVIYLGSSMVGALLVALNIGLQFEGYALFLVSSISGSYLVLKSNASRSLLWVNGLFAIINIVGMVRA